MWCIMEETYYYEFEIESIGTFWGFDDYSHLFADDNDVIYLKPIYFLPDSSLPDSHSFKHKLIGGKKYLNLLYSITETGYRTNNSRWIKDYLVNLGVQEAPARYRDRFSSSFLAVKKEQIIQRSSPRESAQKLIAENTIICSILKELSQLFQLPIDQLGITGSLSIGANTFQDIDIVIYGSTNTISRIKNVILTQQEQYGHVIEGGKIWPCRFRDKHQNLICCFFNYTDRGYVNVYQNLLSIISFNQIGPPFNEIIIDDTYSFAKTPLYKLSGMQYDYLLVLSRESRGRFQKGDRIKGCSIWGYTTDHKKMLVVFKPYQEITLIEDV